MPHEPFTTLVSRTVVLPEANIDTDHNIPARFLTTTSREGLGRAAFHDWRVDDAGAPRPDDPFRDRDPAAVRILVAGPNFGCGSSREHASWALYDFGFRAVVSVKIADIFKSNALKNGLLAVEVDEAACERLVAASGAELTIDLERETLTGPDGLVADFKVEPFARRCLLDGVDSLGFLLGAEDDIAAFEATRR
ncbi:MAG: 3-isopropylmalate dehydratase small subunit [Parvularculaceae bacterium]